MVLDHPVRRRSDVADEVAAGVQDSLQTTFALIVRHPNVKVPALLEGLPRQGRLLVGLIPVLPPHRGCLAAGVDRLALVDPSAQQRCVKRGEFGPKRSIESEFQLGQTRGIGGDPRPVE